MKLLSGLICVVVLFCSMGAGPCWLKNNYQPPVPATPYGVVYQPYYGPVIVQETRYVPVVENRVEYRPIAIVPQPVAIGWNYYPMPVYGYYNNQWIRYNY